MGFSRERDGQKARRIQPSRCTVCTHKERARIEVLRIGGAAIEALAEQFQLNRHALYRHFANHLTPQRKAELLAGPAEVEKLALAAADESKGLLDYFAIVRSVLFRQFLAAAEAQDRNSVATIAPQLLNSLKELGKLTGELRQLSGLTINNNTINLIGTPEFARLSEGLLVISRKHPEARADLVGLLRSLDAAPALPGPNGATHAGPMIEAEAHSVS